MPTQIKQDSEKQLEQELEKDATTQPIASPTRTESVAPIFSGPPRFPNLLQMESRILDQADQLNRINRQAGPAINQFQPFEIDPSVSPAGQFEKVVESQEVGTTHIGLRWIKPPDPEIERFEIWAKNVAFQSQEPFLVVSNVDSPASVTLQADSDTPVVLYLRTIMKNGLSSDLNSSPTVSTSITLQDPTIQITDPSQIDPGVVQDQHFDRVSANKIAILNADIVNLQASKITAGTLAAGVIYSDQINATQINAGTLAVGVILASNILATQISAGTMSAVNVSAGTYSLISGAETMQINGTNGFIQTNSTFNTTIQMVQGQLFVSNNSSGITTVAATQTNIFDGGSGQITLTANGASTSIAINGTKVIGVQGSTVSDPSGGSTVDSEARTAIIAIIDRLQAHGLIA